MLGTRPHGDRDARAWRRRTLPPFLLLLALTTTLVWGPSWADKTGVAALCVLISVSFVLAGVHIGAVSYGSPRVGVCLAATGAVWPIGWLLAAAPPEGIGTWVGWVTVSLQWIPLLYVIAVFPADTATDRLTKPILTIAVVVLGPVSVLESFVTRPGDLGLPSTIWWPTLAYTPQRAQIAGYCYGFGILLLMAVVVTSLAMRLRRAARFERTVRLPILIGSTIAGIVASAGAIISDVLGVNQDHLELTAAPDLGLIAFPVAIFIAHQRLQRQQNRLIQAMSALPTLTLHDVERSLQRALLDDSVRVVLWDSDRERATSAPHSTVPTTSTSSGLPSGSHSPAAASGGPADNREDGVASTDPFSGRVAVPLTSLAGDPIGWITTDARLQRYPHLLEAAATAARMPIEFITQTTIMNTTRDELLASRQRATRVAQQATREVREKVRHDLHDGAQGRFAALAMRLGLIEARVTDPILQTSLAGIRTDLVWAAEELREFAKGLTPPPMAVFLNDLAAKHAPLQVEITSTIGDLEDPDQRADLQYALREAAANALKHADATRLSITITGQGTAAAKRTPAGIEPLSGAPGTCPTTDAAAQDAFAGELITAKVSDDGRGGASPRGGGFEAITDRVISLGGTIFIDSPPHEGTHLTIRFPRASSATGLPPSHSAGQDP